MTYCVAFSCARARDVADTRTNAGVDNISTFRKLHVFKDPKNGHGHRLFGNLSITIGLSILTEGYTTRTASTNAMNSPACSRPPAVGHIIPPSNHRSKPASSNVSSTFVSVRGQIMGERCDYSYHSAGNSSKHDTRPSADRDSKRQTGSIAPINTK